MAHTTKQTTGREIAVYHVRNFGQRDAIFPADFDHVATLRIPAHFPIDTAADVAYQLTQNIEAAWTTGDRVAVLAPAVAARGGCRSTSVGDVFEIAGQRFRVEPAGFREWPAAADAQRRAIAAGSSDAPTAPPAGGQL